MTHFETKAEAVTEAMKAAKHAGFAYAVKWPLGNWTVEKRKPLLRDVGMEVIECQSCGKANLA